MGLSRREYAVHRGCSPSLVQRKVKHGILRRAILDDGSIDATVADQEWERGSASVSTASPPEKKPARKKQVAKKHGKAKQTPAPPDKTAEGDEGQHETLIPDSSRRAVRDSLKEGSQKNGGEDGDLGDISYNDARTANEYEKAELARLKRRQLEGELIEREAAQRLVFGWQRQIRDSLMSWPGQVGPQIAADLGLEDTRAVTVTLETYMREKLEELASVDPPDFT